MDVQRCPHCNLPFLESEVSDRNCPACLRSLTTNVTTESAKSRTDDEQLRTGDSRRPLIYLVAALTALVVVLGGTVIWLTWPRHSESEATAELQVLQDARSNAEKLARKAAIDADVARNQLKSVQRQLSALDTERKKTRKGFQELQSNHEKTLERLTLSLAELRIAKQDTLKAEKMLANVMKAKSRTSPLIVFPKIPFPKFNIVRPK